MLEVSHARLYGLATIHVLVLGCGSAEGRQDGASGISASGNTEPTSESEMRTSAQEGDSHTDSDTQGIKFDVGGNDADDTSGPSICKVVDDMDAIPPCTETAPPDSFQPEIQWEWWGQDADVQSTVTPLVANLTDDNGDGEIDLCDIPDVVVVAGPNLFSAGRIYVLDGASGSVHTKFPIEVDVTVTPAIGDLDGDKIPEIVSVTLSGELIAFRHDGSPLWTSMVPWPGAYIAALALADLDNDGHPEIIAGNQVYDHEGNHVFTASQPTNLYSATTAADLDGDGDLELVLGHAAFHHDGTPLWVAPGVSPGFPHVADLEGDGLPEVLVTNGEGISVITHTGQVTYLNQRPTGDPPDNNTWSRPATIHDFDGNGFAEFALSSANHYTIYKSDMSIVWSALVEDFSGIAAGTAFDFLGGGVAQAMYADEVFMYVFGGGGEVLMKAPRQSLTGTEYPTVADIDNDGSAEILVVSNDCISSCPSEPAPALQAIRAGGNPWVGARRIWNQHTYHVTNVREDGSIPQFEQPHWLHFNTFRTQAQLEGQGACTPPPPG